MQLAILIVAYNTSPDECTTLQSVLDADLSLWQKVSITLWNNGPKMYSDNEISKLRKRVASHKGTVTLYNTTSNFALSKIYNHWIDSAEHTHYIIFDHDDVFSRDFFNTLATYHQYDVIVPILREATIRQTTSPTLRETAKSPDYFPSSEGEFKGKKISALTSGLCLSANFISRFKTAYGSVFNESFALYRIDVCFFNTLTEFRNTHGATIAIANTISHNQSEYSGEAPSVSHFRALEHVYSGCLIRMHSRKKSRRSALRFILSHCLSTFTSWQEFFAAIRCIITKKHPKITIPHDIEFKAAIITPLTLK